MPGNSFSVLPLSILPKFISLRPCRKSIFTTLRFSTVKANNLNAAARQELNRLLCNCRQQMSSWGLRFCLLSYFFVPHSLQYQSMVNLDLAALLLYSDSSRTGRNTSTKSISQSFFFVKIVCYSGATPRSLTGLYVIIFSEPRGYLLHFTVTKQAAFNWQPSPLFVR